MFSIENFTLLGCIYEARTHTLKRRTVHGVQLVHAFHGRALNTCKLNLIIELREVEQVPRTNSQVFNRNPQCPQAA